MRPTRLELSGFTAFREPTELDFTEADLFALTGSTGSGKSSLLDAICFSLYGSVPRIDDRRAVAPVISLGKLEARVRYDFTVVGRPYTVVRVVRRTAGGGATTGEARLELDGQVMAGNAAEVTAAVEQLLGLGFDHFTKSVVLPQGEFAAFLHDKPAKRQDLLRELLDLGVYERMRELAKYRHAAAAAELGAVSGQLDELAEATEEARSAAGELLTGLELLLADVEEQLPKYRGLLAEEASRAGEAEAAGRRVDLLAALKVPDGVGALAARYVEAKAAGEAAAQAAAQARA
ncbi:MAG: AAA family ATPase, partial [Acidimicrobiia bacterium]